MVQLVILKIVIKIYIAKIQNKIKIQNSFQMLIRTFKKYNSSMDHFIKAQL